MDLYHVVLFIHVVTAIVVVGGSFAMDFAGTRAKRARSVDSLTSWLEALTIGSKAVAVSAGITFLAGLYLAFEGDWWGQGWMVVSLVLFLMAGALAGLVMDKGVARMLETTRTFPEGPMTPELGRQLVQPAMALAGPAMVGTDLAIVFLMTNKPAGYAAALTVAAIGAGVGLAFGLRERRHSLHAAPAAASAPVAPST